MVKMDKSIPHKVRAIFACNKTHDIIIYSAMSGHREGGEPSMWEKVFIATLISALTALAAELSKEQKL